MADRSTALRTSDFDYPLPSELIAQVPSPERGESRLLVVSDDGDQDRRFGDLSALIPPGDLLVLNTTRVRRARLLGRRPSGAPAELLLIHPAEGDTWVAMGKPGSALRLGKRISLGDHWSVETVEELPEGFRRVRFLGASAETVMAALGKVPLPPYIDRPPTADDDRRYQTVYAEREGSVAAPTAGLHFTEPLLSALQARGIRLGRLDLEVGPGTFKPVAVEDPAQHPMHPERYSISPELADAIAGTRARGGMVWAVGTTVVRALESAPDRSGAVQPGSATTTLMITPGFRFQVVDRLITNFHLPRSTLLMLVAAFAGYERTLRAYRTAVERRYRFYSYGDAMLVHRAA